MVGTKRNPSWKSLLERAKILFSKSAFCNALTFQTHKCFCDSMLTFVTNIRVLIELAQNQLRPRAGRLCGVCLPLLLTVCVDLNNKSINLSTEKQKQWQCFGRIQLVSRARRNVACKFKFVGWKHNFVCSNGILFYSSSFFTFWPSNACIPLDRINALLLSHSKRCQRPVFCLGTQAEICLQIKFPCYDWLRQGGALLY